MFTWICPQCGREVPPAYNECPDCTGLTAKATPASAPTPSADNPLEAGAAPRATAPPQEAPPASRPAASSNPMFAPSPAQVYARPRHSGTTLPTWLMAILFALAFLGIGSGIYWGVGYMRGQKKPTVTVESSAAKPSAKTSPLQKFVEVTGIRFAPSSKGVVVRFVLVNHSDFDLVGLTGNATIWGSTKKSEEDAVGSFVFSTSMGGQSSKELTMPLDTKLKLIELPDWQNITVDVQITAPGAA